MLFNPMDLIKIKEALYDPNSIPFGIISSFISQLIDIQAGDYEDVEESLGPLFFKKQEMIEHAYQIAKLNAIENKWEILELAFEIVKLNVFGDDKKK